MSYISLSDEETRVIFTKEALSGLRSLDATKQIQVLKKLVSIAEADTSPSGVVREQIANLDIIAAGGQIRLYCKVVEGIPSGNKQYHVVYVLYIDDTHEYANRDLSTYSYSAQRKAAALTSLNTVFDVEKFLDDHNALDADDLRELLP